MNNLCRFAALSLALACVPYAHAQRQFIPTLLADTAVPATAARVYELERLVKRSPNDAVKWHELGMLAWSLVPPAAAGRLPLEKPLRINRVADSALQNAAMIDGKNVLYQMYAANRLLESNAALARVGSKKYFQRAVEAARAGKDNELLAASALEYGRTVWWHFESTENRQRWGGLVTPRSLSDALNPLARSAAQMEQESKFLLANEIRVMGGGEHLGIPRDKADLSVIEVDRLLGAGGLSMPAQEFAMLPKNTFKNVRELLNANSQPLPPDLAGWTDYEEASRLFHEAYRAKPSYPGAFRALAATYAVQNLWTNLERASAKHVAEFRGDSVAWLALGLARYRKGDVRGARSAFDTALARLGPAERKRLDNWARVLPPGHETLRLPSGKAINEDMYWKVANPFWADSLHDPHLEFLARVTYAELRWTVEEFSLPGADTDRGNVFVRYGPPNKVLGFGTAFSDDAMDVVQFWMYDNGLIFAFSGMPTLGTMRFPSYDVGMVAEYQKMFPVMWDNMGAPTLDSVPASLARFRADADSLDVAIAVNYMNPDSIARTMSIGGKVQRHLWIMSGGGGTDRHLTGVLAAGGPYLWRTRVAAGTMLYRAEAFAETATRGQRSTGIIGATTPEFPLTGFGISDLLIAGGIDQAASAPRRWGDVAVTPLVGQLKRGEPLGVLWENYEFGARENRAEYDVTLTLKAEKGKGARIRAEIVGVIAALTRTDVAPDQVTFTFSRSVPHAAAFADWVTVNIPEAPAGTYSVTLAVTDKVSGKTLTRGSTIVIR